MDKTENYIFNGKKMQNKTKLFKDMVHILIKTGKYLGLYGFKKTKLVVIVEKLLLLDFLLKSRVSLKPIFFIM